MEDFSAKIHFKMSEKKKVGKEKFGHRFSVTKEYDNML